MNWNIYKLTQYCRQYLDTLSAPTWAHAESVASLRWPSVPAWELEVQYAGSPTCGCGNPNPYWSGELDGRREFACSECHAAHA
jgi:hypothetical protein